MMKEIKWAISAVIAVILAIVVLSSFYTINDGERGVQLRNGKIIGLAQPGLGFKTPVIESVEDVSIRTFTALYEKIPAYSRDQQTAFVSVSATYRVPEDKVLEMYSTFGTADAMVSRLLSRQVPTQVENVFGQYTAENAVKSRVKMGKDISTAIIDNTVGPIFIESIQIENIDFSAEYETSISDKMKAEVDLLTQTTNAKIAVEKAKGVADSNLAIATAEALAITLKGDAEANAIKARAAALAQNANLVELVKAERWNGALPTTMLPNSAIPFIGK